MVLMSTLLISLAIPQIPNHIDSQVSLEVRPPINLLADKAFSSTEKPGRVAGLAEGICTMILNYLKK